MNSPIVFSFWNYIHLGEGGDALIEDWKALGSNLPMGFVFDPKKDDPARYHAYLREVESLGMKVIFVDERLDFHVYLTRGEGDYRAEAKEAFEEWGGDPAIAFFYLGDEPSLEQTEAYIASYRILKEISPRAKIFGNLLPYFQGDHTRWETQKPFSYFDDVLSHILKETNPEVIGFDCYSQCVDDMGEKKAGVHAFYRCLDHYRQACEKQGSEFYATLTSIGHWLYRVPNEDDIRWQLSVSLAKGARGILWFYLLQDDLDLSYRNGPYFEGLKTSTWYALQRQQLRFQHRYGNFFASHRLKESYIFGDEYEGAKPFIGQGEIDEIKTIRALPYLLSYFEGEDGVHPVLVNASQEVANHFEVHHRSGKTEDFYLAPGELAVLE